MQTMWISGQEFTPALVERIEAAAAARMSLRKLSRLVCEWLGWRGHGGRPAEASCRKALLALERRGELVLPARERPRGLAQASAKPVAAPEVPCVETTLDDLGALELVLVSSRWCANAEVWTGLLRTHHYLGDGRFAGAQLRYLVRSEKYGLVGALGFSAATRRLKARDERIGWSDRARQANLSKVACNSRFLVVPSVRVPNLASHILGLASKRLVSDWCDRYGYAPVLLETFVDGARYGAACYRAAGWEEVGETAGRARAFANGRVPTGRKRLLLRPLCADWKERLCTEPADPLVPREPTNGSWVQDEFGGARLVDGNLKKRLCTLAEDFFAQPLAGIPQACGGSEAKVKAAYRFFRNERTDMRALLRGHIEATTHRVAQHDVVLAVQDTSLLNYTAHPETEGLGPIHTANSRAIGLLLHDTVAFSAQGVPLGVIDAQVWARDKIDAAKTSARKQRPIEEKESMKWLRSYLAATEVQRLCPGTTVVSCGDREADLHELFELATKTEGGAQLLVRADRGRNRRILSEDKAQLHEELWARMQRAEVQGVVDVAVPRKGARPARTARLEIRFARMTLKPPKDKKLDAVPAWAVYALEPEPPSGVEEPLEWMLLTTLAVASFAEATERLRWYALRWGIEVFHRILKSGCRIEDRQLRTADELETCLAIDLVVAWRVFSLAKQGRETPDVPCAVFFEEHEWKALYTVVHQKPPPNHPPPLRDAVRMVAKLGGFLGRKRDGEPGTTTIWRGLTRLEGIAIGFKAALSLVHSRDGP